MERFHQPAATIGDEEVHEHSGWVVEAHDVGSVLRGDVEMVVLAERYSEWDVEITAGVGKPRMGTRRAVSFVTGMGKNSWA
jgi:hypothetical protein